MTFFTYISLNRLIFSKKHQNHCTLLWSFLSPSPRYSRPSWLINLKSMGGRVQRIWLFFLNEEHTEPLMGAKLKYKTHLLNMFFYFFEPFFARLAWKFSKSANMINKKNLNQKRYQNTQNFTLISNPLKKLLKMHKKSYKQNKFDEHEEKWKCILYFCHDFANNFLWCIFQNFFNRFEISVKSAFFDTHIEFLGKIFFCSY
jgi:hypothetical protein